MMPKHPYNGAYADTARTVPKPDFQHRRRGLRFRDGPPEVCWVQFARTPELQQRALDGKVVLSLFENGSWAVSPHAYGYCGVVINFARLNIPLGLVQQSVQRVVSKIGIAPESLRFYQANHQQLHVEMPSALYAQCAPAIAQALSKALAMRENGAPLRR